MTTKLCRNCGKVKETTQFSKRTASTDGLQQKCKQCNSKDNHKFRTENPEHHGEWQRSNAEQHVRNVARYRKADKSSKIYSITAPDGAVYIGMTQTHIAVRMLEHRAHFRRGKVKLPKLHESFVKFGIENHKVDLVLELEGIDRTQLRFIENAFINSFSQQGKSLNILK